MACCRRKQWLAAARQFEEAARCCGRDDLRQNLYISWQSLCQVRGGDVAGLDLCRGAAAAETLQTRVFLNLVLA